MPAPVVTPKGWGCSCVSRPQPGAGQGRVAADSPPGGQNAVEIRTWGREETGAGCSRLSGQCFSGKGVS